MYDILLFNMKFMHKKIMSIYKGNLGGHVDSGSDDDNDMRFLDLMEIELNNSDRDVYEMLVTRTKEGWEGLVWDKFLSSSDMVIYDAIKHEYSGIRKRYCSIVLKLLNKLTEEQQLYLLNRSDTENMLLFWDELLSDLYVRLLGEEKLCHVILSCSTDFSFNLISPKAQSFNIDLLKTKVGQDILSGYLLDVPDKYEYISLIRMESLDTTSAFSDIEDSRLQSYLKLGHLGLLVSIFPLLTKYSKTCVLEQLDKIYDSDNKIIAEAFKWLVDPKKEKDGNVLNIEKGLLRVSQNITQKRSNYNIGGGYDGILYGVFQLLFHPEMMQRLWNQKGRFLFDNLSSKTVFSSANLILTELMEGYSWLPYLTNFVDFALLKGTEVKATQKRNILSALIYSNNWELLEFFSLSLPYADAELIQNIVNPAVKVVFSWGKHNDSKSLYLTLDFRAHVMKEIETHLRKDASKTGRGKTWESFKTKLKSCDRFREKFNLTIYEEVSKKWKQIVSEKRDIWDIMESTHFDEFKQADMVHLYLLLQDIERRRTELETVLKEEVSKLKKEKDVFQVEEYKPIPESAAVLAERESARVKRALEQAAAYALIRKQKQAEVDLAQEVAHKLHLEQKTKEKEAKRVAALKPLRAELKKVRVYIKKLNKLNREHPLLKRIKDETDKIWETKKSENIVVLSQHLIKDSLKDKLEFAIKEEEAKKDKKEKKGAIKSEPYSDRGVRVPGLSVSVSPPPFDMGGGAAGAGSGSVGGQVLSLDQHHSRLSLEAIFSEKKDHFVYMPDRISPEASEQDLLEFIFSTAYRVIDCLNVLEKLLLMSGKEVLRKVVARLRGLLVHDLYGLVEIPDPVLRRGRTWKEKTIEEQEGIERCMTGNQLYAAAVKLFHIEDTFIDVSDPTSDEMSHVLTTSSEMFTGASCEDSDMKRDDKVRFFQRLYAFILGLDPKEGEMPTPDIVFAVGAFIELSRTISIADIKGGDCKTVVRKFQACRFSVLDRNGIFHLEAIDPKAIWAYVSLIKER